MKLKEILKSIHEGLSGDTLSDLNYLKDLAEMYKGHKYEVEITRELSRIFSDIVLKEEGENMMDLFEPHVFGVNQMLLKAEEYINENKYNEALTILEELISQYEESGGFFDDEVSIYRCFREPIEEIVYVGVEEIQREVRSTPEDYAAMYKMYGNILFELKNYLEAQQAFEKSLLYNPMDFEVRCEYIRSFSFAGEEDEFLNEAKKAVKYAYSPHQLSYLFMSIGFYYFNIRYYDIASTCLYAALSFDLENEQAKEMLAELMEESNTKCPYPSSDYVAEIFDKYDIPKAPDRKLLQILHSYVQQYRYESPDIAYYICEYLYDLTKMDSILKIMQEIQESDYVDISKLDEEKLEDGTILKSLVRRYLREQNEDNLYDLLYVLTKCNVIVPTIMEDLGYEEGMKADILRSDDGRLHYPVFTNVSEMPEAYAHKFSRTHARFVDCIEAAKRTKGVCSIVIDAFSGGVELNFDQLSMIEGMKNNTMN